VTPDNLKPTTAVGVFDDRRHADIALDALCRAGFALHQIGFVMPDEGPVVDSPQLEHHHHQRTGEGAATGAAAGGTLGSMIGLAATSTIVPGIGPIIAGGILLGAVAGAVAGMAGGGVLGALIGASVPEEEAKVYERHFHSGRTIVTVQAGERYEEAMTILRRAAEVPEQEVQIHPGKGRVLGDDDIQPGSGRLFVGE
jgi:hypothetical protein